MFYYLHLTRPPPEVHANLAQAVLITPNVANDLRTEYPDPIGSGEEGIEIFYSWVKCIDTGAESQSKSDSGDAPGEKRRGLGPMTPPQKLMNWKGNSYKEVHVFPPKEALQQSQKQDGNGGRWQLLLCTRKSPKLGGEYLASIHLGPSSRDKSNNDDRDDDKFGACVFPILSSPVHFISTTSGGTTRNAKGGRPEKEKKQVRNERIFKLPSPLFRNNNNIEIGTTTLGPGLIRITEHLSYDLDKKVWDSGVGLSHWLVSIMRNAVADNSSVPPIVQSLVQSKEPTILELGAGTGLVSIVLSTLLHHFPERIQANVIATDLPSAMEVLDKNTRDNEHCYPSSRLKSAVLDWDEETLPEDIHGGVDFIIMADVAYNTSSFPSLIQTLSRLSHLRTPPAPPPIVLLAYKERDPDERRLWDMAREIGLHLQEIGRIPGAGGMPVEIYSGTFQSRSDWEIKN